MKNIFFACIFYSFQSIVYGQNLNMPDSQKTKIYIIGVVHSENQFRNADSLLNILKNIRPNLILDEGDSIKSFFSKQHLLSKLPWWYKFGRKLRILSPMPPETKVLFDYKKVDESILVLPFDKRISNRRRYAKNYYQSERKWVSSLNYALHSGLIPISLIDNHSAFNKFNNWFYTITQKSYQDFNQINVTDSIRAMMKLEYEYFPILIDSVQVLRGYKKWYNQNKTDWFVRNEIMAKNILSYIERFKPKNVVVFTGLLHKYILTDLLTSYNSEQNYKLVEYFEK
jgi:hypothetical protein